MVLNKAGQDSLHPPGCHGSLFLRALDYYSNCSAWSTLCSRDKEKMKMIWSTELMNLQDYSTLSNTNRKLSKSVEV